MSSVHGVRGDDRGETLIELIVAIAILGIGAVAILAGFQFSIIASDLGRKQANSDAYVRTVAETIQNYVAKASGNFKACTTSPNYVTLSGAQSALPAGFTATQSAGPTDWAGAAGWSGCGSNDYAQRIEITVTSAGAGTRQATEKLTMIVRKPCNSTTGYTAASPC